MGRPASVAALPRVRPSADGLWHAGGDRRRRRPGFRTALALHRHVADEPDTAVARARSDRRVAAARRGRSARRDAPRASRSGRPPSAAPAAAARARRPRAATPLAPRCRGVPFPLPPRRPPALGGIAPLDIDGKGFAAGGNCFAQLRAAGTTFAPASQPGGNPACGIDNPVQVSAIADRGAPGGSISLPDRPIVSCRMALRFGDWLRSVSPGLAISRNSALTSITTGPGWECRGRNRQVGAKLSAHGNGDALDINTFFFANRARLPVQGNGRDPAFHAARMAACGYFTTVLGPGAAFHDSHLHLDIMRHGRDGSFRLCR